MATSKEFLSYFLEQLKEISDITVRPMMGEYLVYYRGKLVGDICDNRVFVKPVSAVKELLPDAEMSSPYNGAKEMAIVENFEDTQFMQKLFEEMYSQLPEPKTKKRKS